ncbi:MAG: NAD(P)H-dependent oxidoreductase [Bacteroidetes bacterium]|nr:NAD(P)H-dependent oxidoreductase [Bacteroidota bacterium]
MNVLIVHAHHEPASFNSALKNKAFGLFTSKGDVVQVSDLYKMNFKAVSDASDFKELSNPNYLKYQAEQTNASKDMLFSDDIAAEMEKLLWADLIIFNFPLWWFSVPAILKGWVDRVFAMGFAYGGGKGVYDTGVFKGKKGMLCITTGGPEATYLEGGRNGNIDKILFHINHGMLYFTGMDVMPPFIAYSVARLTDDERKGILEKYENYLINLNTVKPITF